MGSEHAIDPSHCTHAVVCGPVPHEGCDVCDLVAALDRIVQVDSAGTPIYSQVAMYQFATDALDDPRFDGCRK